MSHVCKYVEGECDDCAREAHAEMVRRVRSMRGRWLVVYDDGSAVRLRSRSCARRHSREVAAVLPARMIRYRRDRVRFDEHGCTLVVTDARWLP